MCMLPFSFCGSNAIQKHLHHAYVCQNTLIKYIHKLVNVVETKVSEELPFIFVVTFYGCSSADTHYVAVLASYPSPATCTYDMVLL